jgi:hypothetical protein
VVRASPAVEPYKPVIQGRHVSSASAAATGANHWDADAVEIVSDMVQQVMEQLVPQCSISVADRSGII